LLWVVNGVEVFMLLLTSKCELGYSLGCRLL